MDRSVGGRTDRRTVEVDTDKERCSPCFLIEDMAYDISVEGFRRDDRLLCPR